MLVDPLGLWIGPMIPQGVVDTAAGFGDALTFGGTDWVRDLNHTNQWVNPCSLYYTAGQYGGYGVGATLGGAGARAAYAAVRASKNAAGVDRGATNSANGVKLNKQLGSQQQLGETGATIAGLGAKRPFYDADRAARDHGGNPTDFVKKRSSTHTAPDGTKFRTHFIENTKTGQHFEYKTKLID